jgi:protein-tyrosine phosphatase
MTKKILMVCLGNICRSPLAAGVLRKKLLEKGIDASVDSAGFEPYHIGEEPDARTIEIAKKHNIDISSHSMRLFRVDDFDIYDRIFVMDQRNLRDVLYIARNDADRKKVDYLMNQVNPGKNQIVPDPYYGDIADFEKAYRLMDEACEKIADSLK